MRSTEGHQPKTIEDRSREKITEDLALMLGEIVKALHQQFRSQFRQFTGNLVLTVPQILLLKTLIFQGPTSISDLAEHLNLANSTVSGIVDRLERDGFVMRVRDETDRRIVFVQLTERSEQFKEQMPQFHQKFLNELLQGIEEAKVRQMEDSFLTLYNAIKGFGEPEN